MDSYGRVRKQNTNKSTSVVIVAATDWSTGTNLVTVRGANHTLFVQRIFFSPTTYAAKVLTFQDSTGTPVPIGVMSIPAAAPTTGGQTDQYVLDFGPDGLALTAAKNLQGAMSAAGAAGTVRIECYEKLSATVNTGTVNTLN